MFVCEDCIKTTDRHSVTKFTYGRCERCGNHRACYEVYLYDE